MTVRSRALLIGIGNRLRGDDGIGYRLAETLAAKRRVTATPLQALAVQQLTPDLAAVVASADAVLFADAWLQGEPELAPIRLAEQASPQQPSPLSHQLSPAQLLALSEQLYGHQPTAWLLPLPARQLNHGDSLSPTAAQALVAALQLLCHWRPNDA